MLYYPVARFGIALRRTLCRWQHMAQLNRFRVVVFAVVAVRRVASI